MLSAPDELSCFILQTAQMSKAMHNWKVMLCLFCRDRAARG